MGIRRGKLFLVTAAFGLVAAACSGDDGGGTSSGISVNGDLGSTGARGSGSGASVGRDPAVAKSAFAAMHVPNDELDSAAQAVVDLATSAQVGGFLVSSVFDTEERHGSAHVVVKVPSARFEGVVEELSNIGEVTRQELEGRDITPQVLEAQAALQRARATTAALLRRLQAADSEATRFRLREGLGEARARLRAERDDAAFVGTDAAFSTVEVALRATPPPAPPEKPAVERALATAKSLTLGIASAAVLIAGAVIPILGLLAILYLVGAPIVRRLKPRLQGWPG